MNRNNRITIFSALLPALILLLLTAGCKKASDTTVQDPQDSEFWLKGSVINSKTHMGVANASVYFGQTVLTTDANGLYQVNCKTIGCGAYDVRVMASGYGFGFASATISTYSGLVSTIMLKPLEAPVSIGAQGGTITSADPECIVPGGKTTLSVPAGAFSGNINVSLTRFTGIDVPGYAPAGKLNLCAVNLDPAGTISGKPVELRFALPFTDITINQLPLLRYDFITNTWVSTGTLALVDYATNIATAMITEFGTYSLAINGNFSETSGSSGPPATIELPTSGSSIDLRYLAKNEYPGGIPATISKMYLQNTASQNTRLYGARISFTDSTTCIFNYIGSRSDSIPGVKSTSAYYKWAPKVSYATQEMPMTTTINDVTVSGIIHKELYSDASGWQYVHDQGGGGK